MESRSRIAAWNASVEGFAKRSRLGLMIMPPLSVFRFTSNFMDDFVSVIVKADIVRWNERLSWSQDCSL